MEPMITEATHSISLFAFVVMAFMIVVAVVCLLVSALFPDLKSVSQKVFLACLLAGLILAFGSDFIDWVKGFSSF